jgi:low temperature requirement protein LtrA
MNTTNRAKTKRKLVAYSLSFVALAAVLYALGIPSYVFLLAFGGIAGLALGEHFRSKPNIRANRVAYIILFACWVGLVVFFVLSAIFIESGMLQSSVLGVVTFALTGLVVGGVIGDWVGKRRNYKVPNWP